MKRWAKAVALVSLFLASPAEAQGKFGNPALARPPPPRVVLESDIEEHLGGRVDPSLSFTDPAGERVHLGDASRRREARGPGPRLLPLSHALRSGAARRRPWHEEARLAARPRVSRAHRQLRSPRHARCGQGEAGEHPRRAGAARRHAGRLALPRRRGARHPRARGCGRLPLCVRRAHRSVRAPGRGHHPHARRARLPVSLRRHLLRAGSQARAARGWRRQDRDDRRSPHPHLLSLRSGDARLRTLRRRVHAPGRGRHPAHRRRAGLCPLAHRAGAGDAGVRRERSSSAGSSSCRGRCRR